MLVSRLKGKEYYVNQDMIAFIEETPDTVLTMTNGQKIVVEESAEEIINRIVAFKARVGIHLPVVVPPERGE
ncbi:flagellar FlbD family protein [Oscillospiraceae bacterium OttesenSCG-928-G22]|nr:flagellar FlbD family protein [Oscillospiraceae bacterium OttesenSCG-928-G22]